MAEVEMTGAGAAETDVEAQISTPKKKVHEHEERKIDETLKHVYDDILSKFRPELELDGKSDAVKAFYREQNEVILRIRARENDFFGGSALTEMSEESGTCGGRSYADWAIEVSFAVNIVLFIIKIVAAAWSGSLAVVSSAVDSAMDLGSGLVFFFASRHAGRGASKSYPVGRARSQPVAVVFLSAMMSMSGVLLVREGIQSLVAGLAEGNIPELRIDALSLSILGLVIVAKLILFGVVQYAASLTVSSATTLSALALDHFNDTVSNALALLAVGLTLIGPGLWVLDPAFAIAMGSYIVFGWLSEGMEKARLLVGSAAPQKLLAELVRVAFFHDARIKAVDTVRAYYVGERVIAELDVQLDEHMPLRTAHDVGESLQQRVELSAEVERAFVHLDYEVDHNPNDEHLLSAVGAGSSLLPSE